MKRTKQSLIHTETEELIIQAFRSTGFLLINKKLIKLFGLIGAAVLSNYIDKYEYFKKRSGKQFDGWFFLTHKDIMDQLQLKENAIQLVKKWFIKLEFLITQDKGIPAKEWFFIDFQKISYYVFHLDLTGLDPQRIRGLDLEKIRGLFKENKLKENKDIINRETQAKEYQYLVDILVKGISKVRKINSSSKVNQWKFTFLSFFKKEEIPKSRIKKILNWYYNNIGEKYIPVIHSAFTLCEKFYQLEAAMKRGEKDKPRNAHKDEFKRDYDD